MQAEQRQQPLPQASGAGLQLLRVALSAAQPQHALQRTEAARPSQAPSGTQQAAQPDLHPSLAQRTLEQAARATIEKAAQQAAEAARQSMRQEVSQAQAQVRPSICQLMCSRLQLCMTCRLALQAAAATARADASQCTLASIQQQLAKQKLAKQKAQSVSAAETASSERQRLQQHLEASGAALHDMQKQLADERAQAAAEAARAEAEKQAALGALSKQQADSARVTIEQLATLQAHADGLAAQTSAERRSKDAMHAELDKLHLISTDLALQLAQQDSKTQAATAQVAELEASLNALIQGRIAAHAENEVIRTQLSAVQSDAFISAAAAIATQRRLENKLAQEHLARFQAEAQLQHMQMQMQSLQNELVDAQLAASRAVFRHNRVHCHQNMLSGQVAQLQAAETLDEVRHQRELHHCAW